MAKIKNINRLKHMIFRISVLYFCAVTMTEIKLLYELFYMIFVSVVRFARCFSNCHLMLKQHSKDDIYKTIIS